MDYEDYKKQYQRHTDLINDFDGLIATNDKEHDKTSGQLEAARATQAELSGDQTAPENVDVDALEAADADRQRLQNSLSQLDEKGLELRSGRNEVFNAREELTIDNPEMEDQRFSDSIPPPEGERGVGMFGKGAVIALALNASAAEVHNLNEENLETLQTVSSHQTGDGLTQPAPPDHAQSASKEQDQPAPQDLPAPPEASEVQGSQPAPEQVQPAGEQHGPSHHTPRPGDEHTHEEYDSEDPRGQTTTLVMSDPPPNGSGPDAEFVPPIPPEHVAVGVSYGDSPEFDAQRETATPRSTEPDETLTSQTYEVGSGASFAPGHDIPPPRDDMPSPSKGDPQSGPQPLAPPKDTEPLMITSERENQKLLTYQPNQPEPDTRPANDPAVSQPAPAMPAPGNEIQAISPAPEIPPPSDDIPAPSSGNDPQPANDNNIQM